MRALDVLVLEAPALVATLAVVAVRARRARALRSERLARISHELRGPLQAVLLGLEGAQAPYGAIERELQRVVLAVEDLDAERGAGTPVERSASVDVGALLADQVQAWSSVAAARGRRLELAPLPADVRVRADARRIAQATGNLIANALEHGAGTVRVGVVAAAGRISVVIADEGPGPAARHGSMRARRPRPGRGVRGRGLAIAEGIARRHGGRLVVRSGGPGCCVALELPHV